LQFGIPQPHIPVIKIETALIYPYPSIAELEIYIRQNVTNNTTDFISTNFLEMSTNVRCHPQICHGRCARGNAATSVMISNAWTKYKTTVHLLFLPDNVAPEDMRTIRSINMEIFWSVPIDGSVFKFTPIY
jgi:hypothetical protein